MCSGLNPYHLDPRNVIGTAHAHSLLRPTAILVARNNLKPHLTMLRYTIIFLIVALIAAVLGFGGISGVAASIAKVLFVIFLVLFIASLVMGRGRHGPTT
jgi:uncharacterized membrane protein YtjA (UPF0391 family)